MVLLTSCQDTDLTGGFWSDTFALALEAFELEFDTGEVIWGDVSPFWVLIESEAAIALASSSGRPIWDPLPLDVFEVAVA
jgi:hypothetical protein